jgi:hypothetical protein
MAAASKVIDAKPQFVVLNSAIILCPTLNYYNNLVMLVVVTVGYSTLQLSTQK